MGMGRLPESSLDHLQRQCGVTANSPRCTNPDTAGKVSKDTAPKPKKTTPPKNQKLVKSKTSFSRDELADLLETLAARIRAGEITLGTGESAVTMTMSTSFNTTIEVVDSRKRTGIERELELEIDWMVDEAGEPVEKPGPASGFAIS